MLMLRYGHPQQDFSNAAPFLHGRHRVAKVFERENMRRRGPQLTRLMKPEHCLDRRPYAVFMQ